MTRLQIFETLATILANHTGDHFGKRLKSKIETALPGYTVHIDLGKADGSLRKRAISVWGNGIDYRNCVYLCTYWANGWRDSLVGDAKNHARCIVEGEANDARLERIDGKLATLEEDAKEIQAQLKRLLASNGIEHVTAAVRAKYPALFRGDE